MPSDFENESLQKAGSVSGEDSFYHQAEQILRSNFRKKNKKKDIDNTFKGYQRMVMRKQKKYMEDPEVQRLVQQMNQAMLNGQESGAKRMAQEIIEINSKIIYPYEILAEIYDRDGEILKLYEVKKVVA